jgi:hypothetical protein
MSDGWVFEKGDIELKEVFDSTGNRGMTFTWIRYNYLISIMVLQM